MEGKDGLILQGCGGDAQEWVDGINEMFTEAGILKDGSKFKDVSTFQYGELMNSMRLERLTWKPIRSARRYMMRSWCRQKMSMLLLPHRPNRYRVIMRQS